MFIHVCLKFYLPTLVMVVVVVGDNLPRLCIIKTEKQIQAHRDHTNIILIAYACRFQYTAASLYI